MVYPTGHKELTGIRNGDFLDMIQYVTTQMVRRSSLQNDKLLLPTSIPRSKFYSLQRPLHHIPLSSLLQPSCLLMLGQHSRCYNDGSTAYHYTMGLPVLGCGT